MGIPKPPYDPEMAAFLDVYPAPKDITEDFIPALRASPTSLETPETVLVGEPFTHTAYSTSSATNANIELGVFHPKEPSSKPRPAMFYTHGGGMVCGNRYTMVKDALHYAKTSGAVVVTVEYRLSPEHRYPSGLEDCWAGLKWTVDNAEKLGIDKSKLMLVGSSAGGNLAAALALTARDKNGPRIAGMLLDCPMLDDHNDTLSARQIVSEGVWSKGSNDMAWEQYLGKGIPGSDNVSPYAAPGRTTDFSNLPTAFIGVGSTEVFRDEAVTFANGLWKAGVQCELHVWPGVVHSFEALLPTHELSKTSMETKAKWARRVFFPVDVKAKL